MSNAMTTPTLHNLKERATISELAFIEVIEAAVRGETEDLPSAADRCFQAALDAISPIIGGLVSELVRDLPSFARDNLRDRVRGQVDNARREYCKKLGLDVPAM